MEAPLVEDLLTDPVRVWGFVHSMDIQYTNGREPYQELIAYWNELPPGTRATKENELKKVAIEAIKAIINGFLSLGLAAGKIYYNLFYLAQYLESRSPKMAHDLSLTLEELILSGCVRGIYQQTYCVALAEQTKDYLFSCSVRH